MTVVLRDDTDRYRRGWGVGGALVIDLRDAYVTAAVSLEQCQCWHLSQYTQTAMLLVCNRAN